MLAQFPSFGSPPSRPQELPRRGRATGGPNFPVAGHATHSDKRDAPEHFIAGGWPERQSENQIPWAASQLRRLCFRPLGRRLAVAAMVL